MVCTRFFDIEIKNTRIMLSNIIKYTKNEYLKKYMLSLEDVFMDKLKLEYEIKKILRIISDSFDYNDEEVKVILDFIDYLKKIYKI